MAALALEFGAWLVIRGFPDAPPAARLVAYAPAVLLGSIALVSCLRMLLRSPDRREEPPPPNMPLNGNVEAWRLEAERRRKKYERELAESRVSAPQALSLLLGAAGGIGIIYTSLTFSGGIPLINQSVSWLNGQF